MSQRTPLPPLLFAPVLEAEGWLSIDLHRQNCLEYYAKSAPELTVFDIKPDERFAKTNIGRKFVREFVYPQRIRSQARRHTHSGIRPILHVIDHGYGHLCRAWNPSVITCHDLNHFVRPELTGRKLRDWRARVRGMLMAKRIFTVSGHLASEVTRYLPIPRERITVAYNGVDTEVFCRGTLERAAAQFPELAELAKSHQLILNIGSNLERKNLPTLLKAVGRLRHERKLPVKLIKVGNSLEGDGLGPIIEGAGIRGDIIELGFQKPEAVAAICRLVRVLSFPSIYEGFGRPTIEAQASGLACVLADSSCMSEVGGSGALYHRPLDDQDLAAQLETAILHEDTRQSLIAAGYENAKRFTWHAHIRTLVAAYEEVAAEDARG